MDARTSDALHGCAIVISRIVSAPRELVWEVMTNPGHVVHWWGPNGFTTTIQKMEVKPSGVWKHMMHGPDGTDYPNSSVFREVVKPERIVYSHGGGKQGGPGVHFVATWTFEALGDQTKVTIKMVFDTAADREHVIKEYGAIEGGKQTLGRLDTYVQDLSADQNEFMFSRHFNAPRNLVFQVFTDPHHLQHWWGPKGFKVISSKMDFRPGGIYHYGMQAPDGNTMWGKFVYREIVVPERLVLVSSFSDAAGNITRHPLSSTWPLEMLSTFTFTDDHGGTLFTLRWSPLNATDEERHTFSTAQDSMQQGWGGTLEQLHAYLTSLVSAKR